MLTVFVGLMVGGEWLDQKDNENLNIPVSMFQWVHMSVIDKNK